MRRQAIGRWQRPPISSWAKPELVHYGGCPASRLRLSSFDEPECAAADLRSGGTKGFSPGVRRGTPALSYPLYFHPGFCRAVLDTGLHPQLRVERGAFGNCPAVLLRDRVRRPDRVAPPGAHGGAFPYARRTGARHHWHGYMPAVPDRHTAQRLLHSRPGGVSCLAELDLGAPRVCREFCLAVVASRCRCYATRFP